MFEANGTLSAERLVEFEKKIGFELPPDYREFLSATNGGKCSDSRVDASKPGVFLLDYLFGLDLKRELDLEFWLDEFEGEIPPKSLIIGADPGSGFLLLCIGEGQQGIYYYDHAYSFPCSSDEENTYLVFSDFSELFDVTKE